MMNHLNKPAIEWRKEIVQGSRLWLGRAITLAESKKKEDRSFLTEILDGYTGNQKSSRIAISGPPGVGKSSFIEVFGGQLAEKHSVAVLSIDPSSPVTGGSILGDKTRMEKLTAHPNVYIRPSPSGNTLGGVALHTYEVILLCEMAGYTHILIETVGVGQSETSVRQLSDHFLLLLNAGGGDELQGIKRGVMELANTFVFTKSDLLSDAILRNSTQDLKNALHVLRPEELNNIGIFSTTVQDATTIEAVLLSASNAVESLRNSGRLVELRNNQLALKLNQLVEEELLNAFHQNEAIIQMMNQFKNQLQNGGITLSAAVHELMDQIKIGKEIK